LRLGLKLAEKLKSVGVEVILIYPGRSHPQYRSANEYLIERLRK
jgi:predicted nuclease with RNAse H fold